MKFLASFEPPDPPAGLTEKVLARIALRERRILGAKVASSAAALLASVGVSVMSGLQFAADTAHSGFFAIGGLVFTDFSSVLANFSDFALSMVESFPVFSAAAALVGMLFAVWSFAALVDEASLLRNNHEQSFGI